MPAESELKSQINFQIRKKFIATFWRTRILLKDLLPIFLPEFVLVDSHILEKSTRGVVFDHRRALFAFRRVKF